MVLLSGGLDSATDSGHRPRRGVGVLRARRSTTASATRVSSSRPRRSPRARAPASTSCCRLDLRAIGGSALTADIAVPKGREPRASIGAGHPRHLRAGAQHDLPAPCARLGGGARIAGHLHRGQRARLLAAIPTAGRSTSSAFERLANLRDPGRGRGQEPLPHPRAPDRAEQGPDRARAATSSGVDFALTWSCYEPEPDGRACGRCDACQLRREGVRGGPPRRSRAHRALETP